MADGERGHGGGPPLAHPAIPSDRAQPAGQNFNARVTLILCGYGVGGRGADWSADLELPVAKRLAGGFVLVGGAVVAVAGALVAADSGLIG